MNPKYLERYSNANLAIEESRKSRMLPKDQQEVMNVAFGGDEYTARLLRKCVYQMNLDEAIISDFAASANNLLNELELMQDKLESLKEAENHLRDCLSLRMTMHISGNESMLHDERVKGWN